MIADDVARALSAQPRTEQHVIRGPKSKSARAAVFCFHCAGGSASQFRHWDVIAPADVEFSGVQLPGRDRRSGERHSESMPELVDMLTRTLARQIDRPFALFGHSLGALMAFEVARALRRIGGPEPSHLFVAARPAPHLGHSVPAVDELATPQFIEVLRIYGGLDDESLCDTTLMNELLPTIRADFRLVRCYEYRHDEPLSCPIHALGGDTDAACTELQLRAWNEQTTNEFRTSLFQGGHFFLRRHAPSIVQAISRELGA